MISTTSPLVKVIYGEHSTYRVGLTAKELGMKKVMLVFDKGVEAAGLVRPVIENLAACGIGYVPFSKVLPDPPDDIVEEGGALAVEEQVDGIVTIGGGSSIDAAKGINVLTKNPAPLLQWATNPPDGPLLPHIAIPTTAGTGAEVTYVAVITNSKTGAKGGLSSPLLYPTVAIVDPCNYVGAPLSVSIPCAFDVYTHAIDAIAHGAYEPISSAFAEKAIRLVHKSLPKIVENPSDLKARGDLALASTYGGYAINGAMCHMTHTVGHALGAVFHLPHGLCCAIVLPQLLKYYAEWMPEQVKIIADCQGLSLPDDISPKDLGEASSKAALGLMKGAGLKTLKQLEISVEQAMTAMPLIMSDATNAIAPRLFPASKWKAMLEEAYDQY